MEASTKENTGRIEEIQGVVIAHALTARRLDEMALVDWTDEANVSDTIRQELPAPRVVEIAPADPGRGRIVEKL